MALICWRCLRCGRRIWSKRVAVLCPLCGELAPRAHDQPALPAGPTG